MTNSPNIGGLIFYYLTRPLAALPLSFHRRFGSALGSFVGSILHYRRDVVMINLARCFPEKKYDELKSICKQFYRHFGKVIGEAMWFGGRTSPDRVQKSRIVQIDNVELLNSLYDKGKSVFLLCSHCGNWELGGGFPHYAYQEPLKFPEDDICIIYRKLASPTFDYFMARNRTALVADKKHYEGMLESFDVMQYVLLDHRNDLKLYDFISDQYPYSETSKVPIGSFMGQSTFSMDGGPALAHRLHCPVVYMSMKEGEDGNYTIHFTRICEDAKQLTTKEILEKYYALLEQELREQPWNYLWTHKRWK